MSESATIWRALPALSTTDVFCQPQHRNHLLVWCVSSRLSQKIAQHLTSSFLFLDSHHLDSYLCPKYSTRHHTTAQHGSLLGSTPASPRPCRYGQSGCAIYRLSYSHSTTFYTPRKPMRRSVKFITRAYIRRYPTSVVMHW